MEKEHTDISSGFDSADEESLLEEDEQKELIAEQQEQEENADEIIDETEEEEEEDPVDLTDDEEIEIEAGEEDIKIIESSLENHDIVSVHETYSEYYTTSKITMPFLTKFEKAKILGVRAQMLASGSEPLITPPFPETCYEIALKELKEKKIPLLVRRYLPNNKFEDWRVEDLIIRNI